MIYSTGMKEFRGPKAKKYCRSVDIMADAAYAILIKDPTTYSGNLCFDDDILRAEGITDIEQYRAEKGRILEIRTSAADVNFVLKYTF